MATCLCTVQLLQTERPPFGDQEGNGADASSLPSSIEKWAAIKGCCQFTAEHIKQCTFAPFIVCVSSHALHALR